MAKLGPEHPLQLGLAMDAEFFVIMAVATGLDVYRGMEGQDSYSAWEEAVHAVDTKAALRHNLGDVCTAVIVELGNRDCEEVKINKKKKKKKHIILYLLNSSIRDVYQG